MGVRKVSQLDPLRTELNANVWLGVSAKPLNLRGRKSWWCVPKKHAVRHDILVMYQKSVGIMRVERITSEPCPREFRCEMVGLYTVDTTFVMNLRVPITYNELLTDYTLSRLPAVRRRFQGTCFRVPRGLWPKLRKLLVARALKTRKKRKRLKSSVD